MQTSIASILLAVLVLIAFSWMQIPSRARQVAPRFPVRPLVQRSSRSAAVLAIQNFRLTASPAPVRVVLAAADRCD